MRRGWVISAEWTARPDVLRQEAACWVRASEGRSVAQTLWVKGSQRAVGWEWWVRVRPRRSLERVWSRVEGESAEVYTCFLSGSWGGGVGRAMSVERTCREIVQWCRWDLRMEVRQMWWRLETDISSFADWPVREAPDIFAGRGEIPVSWPSFLGVVYTWHLLPHLPAPLDSSLCSRFTSDFL